MKPDFTRIGIRDTVARAFGLDPEELRAEHRQGAHGTKVLSDARAAACWAIRSRLKLSYQDIGEVAGLRHSAVRQAILRAPKRFKAAELEAFAGRSA